VRTTDLYYSGKGKPGDREILRGEEKNMVSKSKEVRIEQKKYWETKLEQRLGYLAEKGVEPQKAAKDATVKKIRANLRETVSRLKAIEALEAKSEEMARKKADKLAAPKKEKGKKKEKTRQGTQEASKRQQKKKKKERKP